MQLVCFCGHFICQRGSRRTPEPTAEHLLCSHTRISTAELLLCHSSPFLGHIAGGTPSSPFLAANQQFCVVVFMFFTPVTQADVEHSWSLLCWGGKHICDSAGAWGTQPCSAAPQLGGSATPSLGLQSQPRHEPIHPSVLQMQEEQAHRSRQGGLALALSFPLLKYICTSGKAPNPGSIPPKACSAPCAWAEQDLLCMDHREPQRELSELNLICS
uniref:Uncharacterized protein n=1 Tax=Zonotrichia albicollis TaxID=44394 RepID=A0A8D2MVZ5_ZONAL